MNSPQKRTKESPELNKFEKQQKLEGDDDDNDLMFSYDEDSREGKFDEEDGEDQASSQKTTESDEFANVDEDDDGTFQVAIVKVSLESLAHLISYVFRAFLSRKLRIFVTNNQISMI